MGKRVRIRCGRCRTVNVSAEVPAELSRRRARAGTAKDAERGLVVLPGVDIPRERAVDGDPLDAVGVLLDQLPDGLVPVEGAQGVEGAGHEHERVAELAAVARDGRPRAALAPGSGHLVDQRRVDARHVAE